MSISMKLDMRQGQALVMTPQLQQAIKLLQLSNMELTAFVDAELERNPLLEREERADDSPAASVAETADPVDESPTEGWLEGGVEAAADPAASLDTDYANIDPDGTGSDVSPDLNADMGGMHDSGWSSLSSHTRSLDEESPDLEAYLTAEISLVDHLHRQLSLAIADPVRRLIGAHLIDLVDEAGYLRTDLELLAERLGTPLSLILETLSILQTFEPAGVCARDLAECMALQLKERNRYDPVIAALLANLPLLAQHNLPALRRACGVDAQELNDMIAELRSLEPKPGLRFGTTTVQTLVADVIVRPRRDGSWQVELNAETLPKVLINQSYVTTVNRSVSAKDKAYVSDCLNTANWLVKSLDQRARTILRVAEEIVRQQDAFFAYGIQHMRPLNLKTVADAISMHESTVSRVTSNKYMATNRGTFELKYFFTSSIASADQGEAHSSESVRHRIRTMIEAERPNAVLSDDRIVEKLHEEGIDIARRTVAKYREAMHIASSVQRRRQKKMDERMQYAS
jgi:RNA polymerase sigma-54 factor